MFKIILLRREEWRCGDADGARCRGDGMERRSRCSESGDGQDDQTSGKDAVDHFQFRIPLSLSDQSQTDNMGWLLRPCLEL